MQVSPWQCELCRTDNEYNRFQYIHIHVHKLITNHICVYIIYCRCSLCGTSFEMEKNDQNDQTLFPRQNISSNYKSGYAVVNPIGSLREGRDPNMQPFHFYLNTKKERLENEKKKLISEEDTEKVSKVSRMPASLMFEINRDGAISFDSSAKEEGAHEENLIRNLPPVKFLSDVEDSGEIEEVEPIKSLSFANKVQW